MLPILDIRTGGSVYQLLAGKHMENEILSALDEIKHAIYLLLILVTLGVIANWIRAYFSIINS